MYSDSPGHAYQRGEDEEPFYTYASFGRRAIAFLIDIVPFIGLVFGLYYRFTNFNTVWYAFQADVTNPNIQGQLDYYSTQINLISMLLWILYSSFMESFSVYQGTFGKYLMDIRVTDTNGERLSLKQALFRNIGKFLSEIILYIGFLWCLFDKRKQTLHDKIAGTVVIRWGEQSMDL
jgi:uncharacterized RDD family membrane protein YckC